MGMLDRWLGGKNDYPPLPADDQARASLDELKAPLEELAGKTRDHLETVPGEHEAYVYLGKPPKHFGIAWLHDGKVDGLNELVGQHKLSQSQVETLVGALGDYDVTQLYVEQESLEERGLDESDLMPITYEDEDDDWAEKPSVRVVPRAELARMMDSVDVVFSF